MDDEYEFVPEDREASQAELIAAANLILTSNFTDKAKLALAILSMTGGYYMPKDVKDLMDYLDAPELKRVK